MPSECGKIDGNDNGFTLLETLVALAILGIVLASLFRLAGGTLVQYSGREARLLMAITAESALNAERLQPGGASDMDWPAGLTLEIERHEIARNAFSDDPTDLQPPDLDRSPTQDLDWVIIRIVDESGRDYALAGAVAKATR